MMETALYTATFPNSGIVLPKNAVDAYWHPLTPEHGFPSLLYKPRALPLSPPWFATEPISSFPEKQKQEKPVAVTSLKKSNSLDFLRRHYSHQVLGSKLPASSQPVQTSSPVFILCNYTPLTGKHKSLIETHTLL